MASDVRLVPRTDVPGLRAVLAAWKAVADAGVDVYVLGDEGPVEDAEFDRFESDAGLAVPPPLRAMHEMARDGLEVADLGIGIHGWPPATLSELGIPVEAGREPQELRCLGGDLGEDVWATWFRPPGSRLPSPVIVVREHDPDDLVVAASGLLEFLRCETAAGLILESPPGADEALDALGVPGEVRTAASDWQETLNELMSWSDPALEALGPYTERPGVTLDAVSKVIAELW